MNEPRDLTPEEEAARRAVRALPQVDADTAFRDRLRAQFVAGARQAPAAASRNRSRTPRASAPSTARRRILWLAGSLAAAAAVVVLVFLKSGGGGEWTVHAPVAGAQVEVDGRRVAVADLLGDRQLLRSGATVVTTEDGLILRSDGVMLLAVSPNSRVTLPEPEGRGLVRVDAGEIRLTSGPRGLAGPLHLETEDASVEVTGTTVAVMRNEMGTCVCVLEGHVDMTNRHDAAQLTVTDGLRWFVNRDGTSDGLQEAVPQHSASLEELREEARTALR